jgi:hypothetical protein
VCVRHLDPAFILVLRLTTTAPLRRNIDTVVFLFVTLFLCLVDRGGLVFCGRIDGIENERRRSSIDELVLRARWDDDEIAALDILIRAGDCCTAGTGSEGEDLVDRMDLSRLVIGKTGLDVVLYLIAYIPAHWNGHKHKLRV